MTSRVIKEGLGAPIAAFVPSYELVLSLPTMAKGSVKSSAATLPFLQQARLVGINDHVKSVRQKPATPYSNSTSVGLKQLGLTAFGFGDRTNAIKSPSPKRRKKLAVDLEIPETQFAINTQSPELSSFDPPATSEGEQGYSSPPPESPPPSSIRYPVATPPLAIPVTPKRRRVTEVPDSNSPPITPFTPYASQKRDNWLDFQPSPTTHKRISPIIQSTEECLGSYSSTPTPTQVLQQRLSTSSPRQQDKDDKIEVHKGSENVRGEVAEGVRTTFGDGDRIIKSSQWWENDDTQNLLPSTQITQQYKNTSSQGYIGHGTTLQESGTRLIQDTIPFHLGLSYKSDPLAKNTDGRCGVYESQADRAMGRGVNDQLESCRNMTRPTLEFRGSTPDPQPIIGYDRSPTNEDLPCPTVIQENPEDVEHCNESQEYPVYGAYRTQQFPSSFYQHNKYRFSSPGIPLSSRVVPGIANKLYSSGMVDNRDQERSQFLPGAIEMGPDAVDEWNDSHDKEGPLQLPSNRSDEATTRDDSQFLPVLINELNTMLRSGVDDGDYEDEQGISIKDENDDGEERGKIGRRHETVTRSQLLPSELMETFPMPPPLSQFSSYGSHFYEYGERETQ